MKYMKEQLQNLNKFFLKKKKQEPTMTTELSWTHMVRWNLRGYQANLQRGRGRERERERGFGFGLLKGTVLTAKCSGLEFQGELCLLIEKFVTLSVTHYYHFLPCLTLGGFNFQNLTLIGYFNLQVTDKIWRENYIFDPVILFFFHFHTYILKSLNNIPIFFKRFQYYSTFFSYFSFSFLFLYHFFFLD